MFARPAPVSPARRRGRLPRRPASSATLALLLVLAGCPAAVPPADPPLAWDHVPVSVQARLADDEPAEGRVEAPVVGEDEVVHLHPEVRFWREHVRHVDAEQGEDGVTLRLWFTEEGAERVGEVTREHAGRRFALLVNGHVVSAPEIVQPLRPDPEVPVVVQARLDTLRAEQLTDAVRRTWPPDASPDAAGADGADEPDGG